MGIIRSPNSRSTRTALRTETNANLHTYLPRYATEVGKAPGETERVRSKYPVKLAVSWSIVPVVQMAFRDVQRTTLGQLGVCALQSRITG